MFKREAPGASGVGLLDDVLAGTAGAPWFWWAIALVALVAFLLWGMKLLGLFPE